MFIHSVPAFHLDAHCAVTDEERATKAGEEEPVALVQAQAPWPAWWLAKPRSDIQPIQRCWNLRKASRSFQHGAKRYIGQVVWPAQEMLVEAETQRTDSFIYRPPP